MNAKALEPTRRRSLQIIAAACAAGLGKASAQTAPIVLGHTYPATGIFAEPAAHMKAAIDASVLAHNASGGVHGRPLKVVSLDDGYEPPRSLANAQALVRDHGAVALISPLGVPNIGLLMPWADRAQVPLIGARSGADSQRGYQRHTFFNVATFGDEMRYIARHLDTIGVRKVAVAAMNNPTGSGIARQFDEAARKHQLDLATNQVFEASGQDAAEAAGQLMAKKPAAVLVAGGGRGAIELVRQLLLAKMPSSGIYCISIIGTEQLLRDLGAPGNGIVITQVMPRLNDPRFPVGEHYAKTLQRLQGQPPTTLIGLEAFLSMQIALIGLTRSTSRDGPPPTGRGLALALERQGALDLGGFRVEYSPRSHHGTRFVDVGIAMNGRIVR